MSHNSVKEIDFVIFNFFSELLLLRATCDLFSNFNDLFFVVVIYKKSCKVITHTLVGHLKLETWPQETQIRARIEDKVEIWPQETQICYMKLKC